MKSFPLALLTIVRQPLRSALGILGVAAVGALLFDMLLLSRGLLLSFGDLLDSSGFDVRVLASDAPPLTGPRIGDAAETAAQIAAIPEVEAVLQLRVREAEIAADAAPTGEARRVRNVDFIGGDPRVRSMWRIVEGRDLPDEPAGEAVVLNRNLARRARLSVGATLPVRGRCPGVTDAAPPVTVTIIGIAEFPFDSATDRTMAGSLALADRLCGEADSDTAEMLLVRSRSSAGAYAAAAAIRARLPDLYTVTNDQLVERFSRVQFSYFRQISTVLATVTLFFGFLLVAVLLTVSVNGRLGEIAALRALGLTRSRVILGVVWESLLLVGLGGLLALPLGWALAFWLEGILGSLPAIPAGLRFFVFEPRALGIYAALLAAASIGAAAYPVRIVATLPIAATLRREVVS